MFHVLQKSPIRPGDLIKTFTFSFKVNRQKKLLENLLRNFFYSGHDVNVKVSQVSHIVIVIGFHRWDR